MRPTKHALAGLLVLAFPATAAAGDGGFGPAQTEPVSKPNALAVGDFDEDGRPDLAVVSGGTGKVEVLLRKAGGDFEPAPQVDPVIKSPRMVVVGDFNIDGHDDLAIGSTTANEVAIRTGKGDGTFGTAPNAPLPWAAVSLALADFNADGREDLVAGVIDPKLGKGVVVESGKGDATFEGVALVKDSHGPVAVGDFNEDTIDDVAVAVPANRLDLLTGQLGSQFTPGISVPLPQAADTDNGLVVADFDGDAHLDLLAAQRQDAVSVRLGAGDRTFPRGGDVVVAGTPRGLAVGDFDGDGNQDFAVGDPGGRIHVRLGDGTGGFRTAPDVPTGSGVRDLVAADFDGDGNDDLAAATADDETISVHLGTGTAANTGNLLVNGGFEGASPAGTAAEAPAIPGWERTGAATFVSYGFPSPVYVPTRQVSPRLQTGGNSYLWGGNSAGTNGVTTAYQTVDVAASAAAIDQGRATAHLSAWLGGALTYEDLMTATATFVGADGAPRGELQIGPVTPADRHKLTLLLRRAGSAAVPPGTRSIRVTLRSDDADKTYSSAIADNVALRLTVAPGGGNGPGGGPGGGGGTPPRMFGARTRVSLLASGRGALIVRVRNRNDFAINGTLRASAGIAKRVGRVALGSRPLAVGPGAAQTVRMALPRALKRAVSAKRKVSVRFRAEVFDPAGQPRQVSRSVRVRPR